jgi:CelD/BcsL family acetyltransferase involved in cellulose biosynthesis
MRSAHSLPELARTLEVAVHCGDIDALAPAWTELEDAQHPGAAFRSWAWSSAWWNSFASGKELLVLLARERGQLLGLLPLFCDRTIIGGRRVALLGEGIVGSDYLGCLAQPGARERVAHAFAAWLAALDCDELALDGLLPGDPLLTALAAALGPARVTVEDRYRCPHLRLAGDFATYLGALPDGTGAQWRRRRRWLEKRPGFAITELSAPDAVVAGLDTLFALHHQRWSGDGGSAAIDSPAVEAFHRHAARRLTERGWSRLYLLSVEGAARAALYGFRHGDRFAFYQAGYDPDWRQRSVGTVLLGCLIERCFSDGVAEFDFLRGCESYKLNWANGWRHTVRLRAPGPSLRARLRHRGRAGARSLYEGAKGALPAPALAWARRARQQLRRGVNS